MIPGAKSCGSVGKLGDRADPEGATASNGDVPEAREGEGGGDRGDAERRGRWTEGREDARGGREKRRERKVG